MHPSYTINASDPILMESDRSQGMMMMIDLQPWPHSIPVYGVKGLTQRIIKKLCREYVKDQ